MFIGGDFFWPDAVILTTKIQRWNDCYSNNILFDLAVAIREYKLKARTRNARLAISTCRETRTQPLLLIIHV